MIKIITLILSLNILTSQTSLASELDQSGKKIYFTAANSVKNVVKM